MSRRFTISLKNSECEKIENEAKNLGIKPIDIINKMLKESTKIEHIYLQMEMLNKQFNLEKKELRDEIKDLKSQIMNMQKLVIESMRMSSDYLAYSKASMRALLMNLMRSKTVEEAQKIMDEISNESIVDAKKNLDKALGNF